MNAGLRDQRIRRFSFSDTTTDGRVASGYAFVGEYWGRVDAPTIREATVAAQGEHIAEAVVTLHRGVTVLHDDLLKSVNDGRYYKVTGVPPVQRRSNERKVFAIYADDAAPTFAITGEPA
jgi:hypothetical protein